VDYLGVVDAAAIGERFRALALAPELDERQRRLSTAAEARSASRGWDPDDCTRAGDRRRHDPQGNHRARDRARPGAWAGPPISDGRKPVAETDPDLVKDLERLVDAYTRPALIEPPAESGEQRKGLSMLTPST
jgi:hypothetical protein